MKKVELEKTKIEQLKNLKISKVKVAFWLKFFY